MQRREFIAGPGAAAWPLAARAQQPAMPVIGWLSGGSPDAWRGRTAAFRRGLADAGYIEGRNAAIEYRWAEGEYDRLPAFALELVRRQVAVIFANSTPAVLAAKSATTTIPIVFMIGGDPVKLGIVASFNRPGANVTGISALTNALGPKQLQLLHDLVPQVAVVALLVNPTNQNAGSDTTDAQAAARLLGLSLLVLKASDQRGIDAAFAALAQQGAGALIVSSDDFFAQAIDQLVALAARHRVPVIYDRREFTAAGGLMSYGLPNIFDAWRQVGAYTGRILKGEKPADLPVQQSAKIGMIINMKTAKALGLAVPQSILLRADEVIE